MKIEIGNRNPYTVVAEKVVELSPTRSSAYIVRLKTSNLGESTELLTEYDSFSDSWEWEFDWYEGGEVELLGFISIYDICCNEKDTKNWKST